MASSSKQYYLSAFFGFLWKAILPPRASSNEHWRISYQDAASHIQRRLDGLCTTTISQLALQVDTNAGEHPGFLGSALITACRQ
mmetsp:Transcript_8613/g.20685  ORF Transcript_8613/g.20685 Transcript_8613/m.20685 type:complete len:84 (-) Transcript_8613:1878-2129(-)